MARRPDMSAPASALLPWLLWLLSAIRRHRTVSENIRTLGTWDLKGKKSGKQNYVLKIPNLETNDLLLREMFVSF